MTHVDDFIDGAPNDSTDYAAWFFSLYRYPAMLKCRFGEWMNKYKLFADYDGKRYRVTGCSRLGDVWLSSDFDRDIGYEHRVDVGDLSNFSDTK